MPTREAQSADGTRLSKGAVVKQDSARLLTQEYMCRKANRIRTD